MVLIKIDPPQTPAELFDRYVPRPVDQWASLTITADGIAATATP
jgi:hypothetical protein